MSIYIRDMEMPKGKPICIVIDVAGQARQYDLNNEKFIDDELYEAVPVPPHGRLIDADALTLPRGFFESVTNVPRFYEWLANAPTIIEAEEGERRLE